MLLGLLLAFQAIRMPLEFKGVWATTEGLAVIVNSTHSVQMMLGDRHLAAFNIEQVPEGSFLGPWKASRQMYPNHLNHELYLGAPSAFGGPGRNTFLVAPGGFGDPRSDVAATYGSERATDALPYPLKGEGSADQGDIRIGPKRLDGFGQLLTLRVKVRTSNDQTKFDDEFFRVAPVESISFDGTFTDGKVKVTLSDQGGRTSWLSGSITNYGETYALRGDRTEGRGYFQMVGTADGLVHGEGYLEWSPTNTCVNSMRQHSASKTDRLIIGVRLGGIEPRRIVDHFISRT